MKRQAQNESTVAAFSPEMGDVFLSTALIADWFSRMALVPMDKLMLENLRSADMCRFLAELGEWLGQPHAVQPLWAAVQGGDAGQVAADIHLEYIQCFEGLRGPDMISLCESAYVGEGPGLFHSPFVEMQAILQALDVSVGPNCCEPFDHLGLELSALTQALRQQDFVVAEQLRLRMCGWVPKLLDAMKNRVDTGFYRDVVILLEVFLLALPSFSANAGLQTQIYH